MLMQATSITFFSAIQYFWCTTLFYFHFHIFCCQYTFISKCLSAYYVTFSFSKWHLATATCTCAFVYVFVKFFYFLLYTSCSVYIIDYASADSYSFLFHCFQKASLMNYFLPSLQQELWNQLLKQSWHRCCHWKVSFWSIFL